MDQNALAVFGLIMVGMIMRWEFGGRQDPAQADPCSARLPHDYKPDLAIRWAFLGNRYARWRAVLPTARTLGCRRGCAPRSSPASRMMVGHNPAARVSIAILLLLASRSEMNGLIVAGTDCSGRHSADGRGSGCGDRGRSSEVSPLAPHTSHQLAYQAMCGFRRPIVIIVFMGSMGSRASS